MAIWRKHIEGSENANLNASAEPVRSEAALAAAAEAAEAKKAAAAYRAKAQEAKQEWKRSWLTFLKTGIIVAALLIVLVASLAWFVNAQQNRGTGMAVQAKAETVGVENRLILYYTRTVTTESGKYVKNYTMNHDSSAEKLSEIIMVPFDMLSLQDENANTPVIIRIPISSDSVTNGKSVNVSVTTNGDSWKDDSGKIRSIFSNITQVQCALVKGDTYPATDFTGYTDEQYEDVWDFGIEKLEDVTAIPFVTLSSGSKASSVTFSNLSVPSESESQYIHDGYAYIYVKIDYNIYLSQEYIKVNGVTGGNIGVDKTEILFSPDFDEIVITGNGV